MIKKQYKSLIKVVIINHLKQKLLIENIFYIIKNVTKSKKYDRIYLLKKEQNDTSTNIKSFKNFRIIGQ